MAVTVVVIEDEPMTRELIVGYLKKRGSRVTGCSTLAEAALALRDVRPHVIVSDVGLPDGNGANFCLDNVPHLPHAKWLIMSAEQDLLFHLRILMRSPDPPPFSVFDKPVPLRALDDIVHQAMGTTWPMRLSAVD